MIIAICGLQGSGKDTFGSILVKNHNFVKLSFASLLKDILSVLFDWNREMLEGTTKESREWREQIDEWWSNRLNIPKFSPRYALQYFGTEIFRNHFHDEIWIAALEKQLYKYTNVVITDCRFPNEINTLKKYNAIFIRITKGYVPEWFISYENNLIEKPEGIHPSEYLWIKTDFDYKYINNGTIEEMTDYISNLNFFN